MARISKKSIKKAAKRKQTKRVVNKRIMDLIAAQFPQSNPLAEMPKGVNLRQTLLQRASIGLPQNAPLSSQQGEMFNLRNEFTKQGDLLKEMKLQIKRDDDARKAERERRNADNMLRGAHQRNELQKQADARRDELMDYEHRLKQEEIDGETAHAQALVNQHEQMLKLGQLKIEAEKHRKTRQELDDKGLSIQYDNEIQLLEQQIIAITSEINLLQEGGAESIAKSKNVAEGLSELMSYLEAVKTELATLRKNKGKYDAIVKAFNGNSIESQASTLESLLQVNADDNIMIEKERMKLKAVRDMELDFERLDNENAQLTGKKIVLESLTELKDKSDKDTDFAKRKKSAINSHATSQHNISNIRHNISLRENEIKAVEALEKENLAKSREIETLTNENDAINKTVNGQQFKTKRSLLLTAKGNNEVKLMTAKSKDSEMKHKFEQQNLLARKVFDEQDEYDALNTTNEKLETHTNEAEFTDAKKKLIDSIGESRYNVAAAKRKYDDYHSQIHSVESLKSDLRKAENTQQIQDKENEELKKYVEKDDFKKEKTDSIDSIAKTSQQFDVAKTTKNVYLDKLNTNETLQKRANKLSAEQSELTAYNTASSSTLITNNVVSSNLGRSQAKYDAENRKAALQKEYKTAEDNLTQLKARNTAIDKDKDVIETNVEITALAAKLAETEERAAALDRSNRGKRNLQEKQALRTAMSYIQNMDPESMSANADAIISTTVAQSIGEYVKQEASYIAKKDQFFVDYPGVYSHVMSLMPETFNYDNLSAQHKALFNNLLEQEKTGVMDGNDVDSYNAAFGCNIELVPRH